MAEKQPKHGGKRTGAGRKPADGTARRQILSIRGSDAYKEWVEALAGHLRLSVADTIDHALVELARARGFDKAPPKR